MKVYLIVEGHGEVAAAPILMRRLLWEFAQVHQVGVGSPVIRRTQSQLRREAGVTDAVRLALAQPDCAAVLVLFDGEDDCPVHLAAKVRMWARAAAGPVPCEVVIAYREYETWLLAAVESLRGQCRIAADANAPADPASKRDAKGELETFMPPGASYSPTIHQQKLTAVFDPSLAYQRNRSFRKMTKAVGDLLHGLGHPVKPWPPAGW